MPGRGYLIKVLFTRFPQEFLLTFSTFKRGGLGKEDFTFPKHSKAERNRRNLLCITSSFGAKDHFWSYYCPPERTIIYPDLNEDNLWKLTEFCFTRTSGRFLPSCSGVSLRSLSICHIHILWLTGNKHIMQSCSYLYLSRYLYFQMQLLLRLREGLKKPLNFIHF